MKHRSSLRSLLAASLLGGLASLTAGCGSDAPPMGQAVVGRDSLPVMVSYGISKLISDSGVIRYKIISEEWRVYDRTQPPRWEFPKGIFIERYDDRFKVNMHITADSAWLYDQHMWKLRGHIVLDDREAGTRLMTSELYWDMNTGELSSDVYSRLQQPDEAIEGDWFRARIVNRRPVSYHIRRTSGFMPAGGLDSPSSAATVSEASPESLQPVAADDDTLRVDSKSQREPPVSHRKMQ